MMYFMVAVTIICIVMLSINAYLVWVFAKDVFEDSTKSRNSTSESELRNPIKRVQWG